MNKEKSEQEKKMKKENIAKAEEKKEEKTDNKKEIKKEEKPVIKEKAIVRGESLRLSPKHCFAICKMLRGKNPDKAIEFLEQVIKGKKVVRMTRREVAHQKGKGIAGGKYPKKASLEIINLLKQLKANAIVNGIDNPIIITAMANKASQPYRREGRRAKRSHIYLEVREKNKLGEKI